MAETAQHEAFSQLQIHDDDHDVNPSELFGKHVWRIENFSKINEKEIRSKIFQVGGHDWYILMFPQGCNVCDHISLFLCVANRDKLHPDWTHLSLFTIAVLNSSDSKKSKYSDALHSFWSKEHDWGWKKYMALPKLQEGFIDANDCLTVEVQVQVIRERFDRPFPCLADVYRRELARVYFINVEKNCRHFVEETKSKLAKLIQDKEKWTSFCDFWLGMDKNERSRMSREKMDVTLEVLVEQFFKNNDVRSALLVDSLFWGLKVLEHQTKNKEAMVVSVEKDMFVLGDDLLLCLERAALEPLPPIDVITKVIDRNERDLAELGRQIVEIFVLNHIFSKIEFAHGEAVALKKQEEEAAEKEKQSKKMSCNNSQLRSNL